MAIGMKMPGKKSKVINTLEYRSELCTNCGMCTAVCPQGVFSEGDDHVELINFESCMECGACEVNCPTGAIEVDSGVGCAAAMMMAALKGKKDVSCCGETDCCGPQP